MPTVPFTFPAYTLVCNGDGDHIGRPGDRVNKERGDFGSCSLDLRIT